MPDRSWPSDRLPTCCVSRRRDRAVLVAKGVRVQRGVVLSLLAHASLLLAIGLLITRSGVPPTPEQPSVMLVFAPAAAAPPQPEQVTDQMESVMHALPPPVIAQTETPTPRVAKPRPTHDAPVEQAGSATPVVATAAHPVAGMASDLPP